jgi:hypothetical protein
MAVLSGAIRSRVENGAGRVYQAGESWTGKPGAHHMVGESASSTGPARLLAIFVADTNDRHLVTFDKSNSQMAALLSARAHRCICNVCAQRRIRSADDTRN